MQGGKTHVTNPEDYHVSSRFTRESEEIEFSSFAVGEIEKYTETLLIR